MDFGICGYDMIYVSMNSGYELHFAAWGPGI